MKRAAVVALVAVLVALLCFAPRASGATTGSVCEHTHQCSAGLWCLAESPTSTSGHCEKLNILYP